MPKGDTLKFSNGIYHIMFENIKKIYMIGIGGISMSAIALHLHHLGFEVKGSDCATSSLTENLVNHGIEVCQSDNPSFVEWADVVVVSGAISQDDLDVVLAEKFGKQILSRSQVLGFLSRRQKCIAISGTHGKTTTTGMLATVMLGAGLDPTIHIGGILNEINSNLHIGKGEYFLTEACEYKDSFLSLDSDISVVLNVEEDHMDYFKNMDNLLFSFKKFTKNTKKYGFCVVKHQIKDEIACENNVLSFGEGGFVTAKKISEYLPGRFEYDLYVGGEFIDRLRLSAFGKHNVENSLAVVAVALLLDVDLKDIKKGLAEYKGVKRRMELINNSPFVIHDYAHHPTEIKATIDACKNISKKLIVVFQPHLFSRTKDLYQQFLTCFDDAMEVWLLPIYPAREQPIDGVSSKGLSLDLSKKSVASKYFNSFIECEKQIRLNSNKGLFVVLGAGDIESLAQSLKKM